MPLMIKSYQTAFHHEEDKEVRVRRIIVPDSDLEGIGHWKSYDEQMRATLLELAFYYGQNDFQSSPGCYSMSVGDVVELADGTLWRCMPAGWSRLAPGEDPTALRGREARTVEHTEEVT